MSNDVSRARSDQKNTGNQQNKYEFSDQENKTFGNLSLALTAAAGAMGALAVLKFALAALNYRATEIISLSALEIFDGVILILVSMIALRTHKSVKHIITTQGDDIGHLMTAVKSLRQYFALQGASVLLMVILTLMSMFAPDASTEEEGESPSASAKE
jgi:hypothetical protein